MSNEHITDERLAEVLTEAYGSPEWTMADVRAARAVEAASLALRPAAQPASAPAADTLPRSEFVRTINALIEGEALPESSLELLRSIMGAAPLGTKLYTTPQSSPSTARKFVEWMKSQPEDREPTTIDGALAEFEAQRNQLTRTE